MFLFMSTAVFVFFESDAFHVETIWISNNHSDTQQEVQGPGTFDWNCMSSSAGVIWQMQVSTGVCLKSNLSDIRYCQYASLGGELRENNNVVLLRWLVHV